MARPEARERWPVRRPAIGATRSSHISALSRSDEPLRVCPDTSVVGGNRRTRRKTPRWLTHEAHGAKYTETKTEIQGFYALLAGRQAITSAYPILGVDESRAPSIVAILKPMA